MAGPVDGPLEGTGKTMGSMASRYTTESITSSRARSRARSHSRSRSQIRSLSSTPIPKLATKVDIPRIRINTATPLSQSDQRSRNHAHLRTISIDTIDLGVQERPSPPSSPEEELDERQYPPRHPVPSMQAAFEESMYEQLSSARGETGGPGASANWRSSLQRSSRISSRASIGSNGKSQFHPLEKLVAQVAFGIYLLHQGLAISENEVVRILQGHVNDMDDFLSTTTRDFDKARDEISKRTQHLKFPLEMGPPAAEVFDNMLKDRKFRTELLESNSKVESVVRRTARMSTRALKDIGEGLRAVRHLARYLSTLKEGWRSKNLVRVYGAMVQNVEQWYRCLIGLQKKGSAIADKLSKLKSILFEIEKRAGAASRADKSLQPPHRARMSSRKSAMLASKPLPETPVMTPVMLPIQKPDPSTLDLTGDSPDPQPISLDNTNLAPSLLERRPQQTRRNSLRKARPTSRGRRQSIRLTSTSEVRGVSPVSPISTAQDASSKTVLRRKSTKRSSQAPSPVSPITDRGSRSSSLWPKGRQSSRRFTSHPNRPISFLLENSDESIENPIFSTIEPLRIVKRNEPLPVPNPYGPDQSLGYNLPRTSSGQPPITIQSPEAVEFYGKDSIENLKVPKESRAPRIKTPDIPTPLHFEFTFDNNNSRSSISPLSMLPPADVSGPSPGLRPPAAPSPPQTPEPSEPSASMIEALHPVHPGSHYPIPISPHTLPRPPSSGIYPVHTYEDPLRLGPLVGPGDDEIEIQGEPITVRRLQEQEAEQRKGGVRRLLYDEHGVRRCGKCKLGTRVFGGVKGDVVLDEQERGRRRDKDRAKNEKRFEKEERKLKKDLQVRDRSEERRKEMERLREEGKCEVM
ncbi:hypothetical protein BJ508DRAFT_62715 [Ascobolus immersus RN42]|uniref:Uncharacterized protein n=1 Tax=Ascobolus immersus RN42 TaxID=1160509 RepID=A0A3N4IN93_ASCIM|nr:hypothetical protein BJ508DRAFT_62715 [Ascobolus immersus RN42]